MPGSARVEGISYDIPGRFETAPAGPYWPPERVRIDQGYANVGLPGRHRETAPTRMQSAWPLDALIGDVGSWSATRRYFAATGHDPLPELRHRPVSQWGDPDTERRIRWPLFGRAARLNSDPIS